MKHYSYLYDRDDEVMLVRKDGKRSGRIFSIHLFLWAVEKAYLADQKKKLKKAEKLKQQQQNQQ